MRVCHFLIWTKEPDELGATLAINTNKLDYSHKAPHLWLLREGKGKKGERKGRRELELAFSVAVISLEGTHACLWTTGSLDTVMLPAKTL